MPPRHIVIDMGNVIAFFDHRRACRQIADLGRPDTTEDEVFDLLFHQPLERQYDTGAISTEAFLTALRAAFGIVSPDAAIADAWSDIFEPNAALAAELPTLKAHAASLVLASNTNPLHIDRIRKITPGVIYQFDARVLSFEVGCRKPAERFFQHVIAAAGGRAEDCFYVDDREDFVAAARALGMDGIVYEREKITPGVIFQAWRRGK